MHYYNLENKATMNGMTESVLYWCKLLHQLLHRTAAYRPQSD